MSKSIEGGNFEKSNSETKQLERAKEQVLKNYDNLIESRKETPMFFPSLEELQGERERLQSLPPGEVIEHWQKKVDEWQAEWKKLGKGLTYDELK